MKKLFTTLFMSCAFIITSAQIIHVPTDQPTIQSGINAAITGDTVLVDIGTYYENINFYGKAITVTSNFIMNGDTNYINNTIIDGSQPNSPDFASVVSFTTGEDTTSIISGFTITGGTGLLDASIPARFGGGIVCINASAKITHNKIISNEVDHQTFAVGAGIACTVYLQSKWIVIEHNIIADNYNHAVSSHAFGGGIFIGDNTGDNIELRARVNDNTIENNSCYSEENRADGGGIRIEGSDGVTTILSFNNNIVKNNYLRGSSTRGAGLCGIGAGADIANNVFSDNYIDESSVQFRGAAICFKNPNHRVNIVKNLISGNISPVDYSDCRGAVSILDGYDIKIIVEKNIFTNNIAYRGAGFYSRQCYDLIVSNNLFYGNLAYQGAALAFDHSLGDPLNQPLIINNTFYENTAINAGGAIRFDGELNAPIIYNCIFWDNEAPTGKDVRNESALEIEVSYSDLSINGISGLWNGEGNINEDPIFVGSGDYPYQINDYSPCIDAGNSDTTGLNLPDFDLADEQRFINNRVDMGAYEWNTLVGAEEYVYLELKLWNFPNPFAASTCIKYELQQTSAVQFTIYNYQGEMIEVIPEKRQVKGNHNLIWQTENLPPGVYYCKLRVGSMIQTLKMLKMK